MGPLLDHKISQHVQDISNVNDRIQTARKTMNAAAGAGLHSLNSVSAITSKKIIDIYMMPRLTYGSETLVLLERDIEYPET
jgi:hypothetical protein